MARSDLPSGTVTFLFTDIEGSTRLLHELGDEAYAEALAEHRRALRRAFACHGGVEVDTEGDAFFVAFPTAPGALQAAAEAQEALASGPIRVRMGLHTGTPLVAEEGYVGVDVHRAARITACGHGGQVLVSAATAALAGTEGLRDLGEHRLKDLSAPERIYQLGDGDFGPVKSLHQTNLPIPATPFLGREHELSEVLGLLEDARLLTLTGPGGTGKTRLGLQAAAQASDGYPDGVFWVPLAPLRDPTLVTETVAQTLGAKDGLAEHVSKRELLLLLDNFEQVVDAAPELSQLLAACPNLRLLVTSRELLRIAGEVDYPVPPLAEAAAVELFCERSRLDPDETIAELCRRLDDLPLALELAAARARVLSPAQILERLDQRLDLLKGGRDADPRQETLRATIGWSHGLLSGDEQQLFARLAVFRGGCTLEAAEDVCEADLDFLQSLVDKSLLRHTGERFWMLETIREYAAERLSESYEVDLIRRRHAEFFLAVAEDFELRARTGDQSALFERLSADDANLRQAVEWAEEQGEPDLEVRLVSALWGYWFARGHIREGRRWLDDALARTDDPPPRALLGRCLLRQVQADEYEGLCQDAMGVVRLCEQAGDDFSLAQAWNLVGRLEASCLGRVIIGEEAWRRALEYAELGGYAAEKAESMGWLMVMSVFGPRPTDKGIELCKEFFEKAGDDEKVRAFSQVERAVLEAMRGDFETARTLLVDGHRAFEALGLRVWAANNAQEGYYVEMLAGNAAGAAEMLRVSYQEFEQMGERGFMSTIAGMLANALEAQGEDEEAEHFSRESKRLAASDDGFSQALWRTALAKVLARRGEFRRAEVLAREALDQVPPELLLMQSEAYFDLALVLTAGGHTADAKAAAAEAARLHEQKGNLVALENARGLVARLS